MQKIPLSLLLPAILLSFVFFSFTDGLDYFTIYVNQTRIGFWREDEPKTYEIKTNFTNDTLKFDYGTDWGGELGSKLEIRSMSDSVIDLVQYPNPRQGWGEFHYLLSSLKTKLSKGQSFQVFILPHYLSKPDPVLKEKYLVAILKFI
jgi:hypothetical protein